MRTIYLLCATSNNHNGPKYAYVIFYKVIVKANPPIKHFFSLLLSGLLHSSGGPRQVLLTQQHKLHHHQLLRRLPRPEHLPSRQRSLPRHGGRANRRHRQRHQEKIENEGSDALLSQHSKAGLPRRPRRPSHKHQASEPRVEHRR